MATVVGGYDGIVINKDWTQGAMPDAYGKKLRMVIQKMSSIHVGSKCASLT